MISCFVRRYNEYFISVFYFFLNNFFINIQVTNFIIEKISRDKIYIANEYFYIHYINSNSSIYHTLTYEYFFSLQSSQDTLGNLKGELGKAIWKKYISLIENTVLISLAFRFFIFALLFFSVPLRARAINLSFPDTRHIVFFKDARNAIYHKTRKG